MTRPPKRLLISLSVIFISAVAATTPGGPAFASQAGGCSSFYQPGTQPSGWGELSGEYYAMGLTTLIKLNYNDNPATHGCSMSACTHESGTGYILCGMCDCDCSADGPTGKKCGTCTATWNGDSCSKDTGSCKDTETTTTPKSDSLGTYNDICTCTS